MYKMEILLDKEYTVIVFLLSLASTRKSIHRSFFSIFRSYKALQGIIVSFVLLLTSTVPHISHIYLLYSLKAIFLL